MDLVKLLTDAVADNASDIFIVAGRPFSYKKNNTVVEVAERLMPENTNALVNIIYELAGGRDISNFLAAWPGSVSAPINSAVPLRPLSGSSISRCRTRSS